MRKKEKKKELISPKSPTNKCLSRNSSLEATSEKHHTALPPPIPRLKGVKALKRERTQSMPQVPMLAQPGMDRTHWAWARWVPAPETPLKSDGKCSTTHSILGYRSRSLQTTVLWDDHSQWDWLVEAEIWEASCCVDWPSVWYTGTLHTRDTCPRGCTWWSTQVAVVRKILGLLSYNF